MILEFQFSLEKLKTLIQNRIQSTRILYTEQFEFLGNTCLIDHFEFEPPFLQSVADTTYSIMQGPLTGAPVLGTGSQLAIRVIPVIKKVADVKAAGVDAAPDFQRPTIDLFFDLGLDTGTDGVARFNMSYASARLPPIADPAAAAKMNDLLAKMASKLPALSSPIDLSALNSVLGGPVTVRNGGVSADWFSAAGTPQDPTRVSLRLETAFADDAAVESWRRFFLQGRLTDRMLGRDWGLFVDREVMVSGIEKQLRKQLEASAGKFELKDGPHASWEGGSSGDASTKPYGQLSVTFSGAAKDACSYGGLKLDVDADVTTAVQLRVESPNVLKTQLDVDWDLSDWDVAFCALAATFAAAVTGSIIGGIAGGPVGAIVGAIIGALSAVVTVVAVASSAKPSTGALGACKPTDDSKKHYLCESPVDVSVDIGGTFNLEASIGTDDGLVLCGPIGAALLKPSRLGIVDAGEINWSISHPCSSGSVVDDGFITLQNKGECPMYWGKKPEPIDDPLSNYHVTPVSSFTFDTVHWGAEMQIRVHEDMMGAYAALPPAERYPLKLWIWTSGGVRYLVLPSSPELTPERAKELEAARLAAQDTCRIPIRKLWDEKPFTLAPEWPGVDPWGGDDPRVHIWQVVLTGVAPGDRINLLSPQGRTLTSGWTGPTGLVQLSALVPPGRNNHEVQLMRQPKKQTGRGGQAVRDIRVKQIAMRESAQWGFPAECRAFHVQAHEGRTAVWAACEDGLRVYDITSPAVARLSAWEPIEGLTGLTLWNGTLVAGGRAGLFIVTPEGRLQALPGQLPVTALAATAQSLWVLTNESVREFDANWNEKTQTAFAGGASLAATNEWFAVSSRQSVELFRTGGPNGPRRWTRLPARSPRSVSVPSIVNSRQALCVELERGAALVYDLAGNRPVLVTEHQEAPWYLRASRWGQWLVRLDAAAGRTATLYQTLSVEKEPLAVVGVPKPNARQTQPAPRPPARKR